MPSITESLASFVTNTGFEDLPGHTVERAKIHFLDWIAATCAGVPTAPGQIFLEHARRNPEPGPLTAIGLPDRRGARQAPFVNGALSKASQLDDMDRVSIVHPAVAVSPAAFAAAELRGRSGKDLLRAVILGYEVASRIGEAIGSSHYDWWHSTSTCGVLGAATAAGLLLGLAERQLVGALGNAGTQAAGLRQCVHDDLEFGLFLHAGKAAGDGLLSAQLAELGFQGAPNILEGRSGLFAAASNNPRPEAATAGLAPRPSEYRIEQVSLKRWPSCMYAHTSVLAALDLLRQFAPEDAESITVASCGHARSMVDRPHPATVQDARYSVQFGVAAALVHGRLSGRHYAQDVLENPRVLSLMERIRVEDAPDLLEYYPRRWPGRVTVRLRGGATLEKTVIDCPGGAEQPLGFEDVVDKLYETSTDVLSPAAVERLIGLVGRLESVGSVGELFGASE